MAHVSRSDHPTDADLLERLLARESHPHLARCVPCAERADAIAREIDPARGGAEESCNDLFYRRQAARIRARIADGERRRSSLRSAPPKLAWAGAAAAAVVALAVGLGRPLPSSGAAARRARSRPPAASRARRTAPTTGSCARSTTSSTRIRTTSRWSQGRGECQPPGRAGRREGQE